MLDRTEALVLRIHPFSRTSHVVHWLTPHRGQLVTLVKGALRPKSAFLGQYDWFYTCELVYYTRERTGLHIARECCPLHLRARFREDWRAALCASYVCALVFHTTVPGGHQQEVYRVTQQTLDALVARGAQESLLWWFEVALLQAVGYGPELRRCTRCATPLSPGESAVFVYRHGGTVCRSCLPTASSEKALVMSAPALAAFRDLASSSSPRMALRYKPCSPDQGSEIRTVLGAFLAHHVEAAAEVRRMALWALRNPGSCPSRALGDEKNTASIQ